MSTTRVTALLRAPRAAVYQALTDPAMIGRWRFPDGMTSVVELREDGGFRVTLTYEATDGQGKTTARSDTTGPVSPTWFRPSSSWRSTSSRRPTRSSRGR
jgi:uncharacterized protein YndB with AHSA1/START domain